jgi:hypothetical protein
LKAAQRRQSRAHVVHGQCRARARSDRRSQV